MFIERTQNSRITQNIWKNYSRMDVTIYLDLLRMVTHFSVEYALVTHHEKVTATFRYLVSNTGISTHVQFGLGSQYTAGRTMYTGID